MDSADWAEVGADWAAVVELVLVLVEVVLVLVEVVLVDVVLVDPESVTVGSALDSAVPVAEVWAQPTVVPPATRAADTRSRTVDPNLLVARDAAGLTTPLRASADTLNSPLWPGWFLPKLL